MLPYFKCISVNVYVTNWETALQKMADFHSKIGCRFCWSQILLTAMTGTWPGFSWKTDLNFHQTFPGLNNRFLMGQRLHPQGWRRGKSVCLSSMKYLNKKFVLLSRMSQQLMVGLHLCYRAELKMSEAISMLTLVFSSKHRCAKLQPRGNINVSIDSKSCSYGSCRVMKLAREMNPSQWKSTPLNVFICSNRFVFFSGM